MLKSKREVLLELGRTKAAKSSAFGFGPVTWPVRPGNKRNKTKIKLHIALRSAAINYKGPSLLGFSLLRPSIKITAIFDISAPRIPTPSQRNRYVQAGINLGSYNAITDNYFQANR
jgi:hypothetical protein